MFSCTCCGLFRNPTTPHPTPQRTRPRSTAKPRRSKQPMKNEDRRESRRPKPSTKTQDARVFCTACNTVRIPSGQGLCIPCQEFQERERKNRSAPPPINTTNTTTTTTTTTTSIPGPPKLLDYSDADAQTRALVDAYKVLGFVDGIPTATELKKRWHQLSRESHPDKVDAIVVAEATERQMRINEAYQLVRGKVFLEKEGVGGPVKRH